MALLGQGGNWLSILAANDGVAFPPRGHLPPLAAPCQAGQRTVPCGEFPLGPCHGDGRDTRR